MKIVYVDLSSVDRIQSFARALSPLSGDFELLAGHHVVDARSVMGIFTLDWKKPIRLKLYQDTAENLAALGPFLCEKEGLENGQ